MMNHDSIRLLQECNSGCKNATNSMEQVKEYIKDPKFEELIDDYNRKHIAIGEECQRLLEQCGEDGKDPSAAARAVSWIGTEVKLALNDTTSKIAGIMMDGCNMGLKSVSGYRNQYSAASPQSVRLADNLISTEQNFMRDLMPFM